MFEMPLGLIRTMIKHIANAERRSKMLNNQIDASTSVNDVTIPDTDKYTEIVIPDEDVSFRLYDVDSVFALYKALTKHIKSFDRIIAEDIDIDFALDEARGVIVDEDRDTIYVWYGKGFVTLYHMNFEQKRYILEPQEGIKNYNEFEEIVRDDIEFMKQEEEQ
jgi:hypothetical protein